MRVPLNWLREWVDVPWDVDELAERLTAAGLAVEQVDRPGREVAGVIVARITGVEEHPDAERLWVCRLDTGRGNATVVTGAPNAREGALAVYAPPGATLAGGQKLARRRVRGVESEGMLCATWELGLPSASRSEEDRLAEGLLLLPGGSGEVPGADAGPLLGLGEPVLTLELTPNYAAHCQSILGVAREVAALAGTAVHPPALPEHETATGEAAGLAGVVIEAGDGCGRYVARIIDQVRVAASPLWLRRRLQLAGMRPINNVVDVTNYVMLELGQPLHGFDLTRLAGGRIIVRRARAGESIRTLDGEERALTPEDLVIADARRPVAIAGIMGGADSEVTPDTRSVLLEAAHFHGAGVLRTSRRLGLRTEASARFDKGLDPEAPELASRRAAALMAHLTGGRVLAGRVEARGKLPEPVFVRFRPDRINGLLGLGLERAEIEDMLTRLGFGVDVENERVAVPSYRTDIQGDADLAEEVARLYGYDNIPARLPGGSPATTGRPASDRLLPEVRRQVVAGGFSEIITFSFAAPDLADRLRLPGDHPQRRPVRVANPMSEEQGGLRSTLLGGMLEALGYNARRRQADLALFEIGTVFAAPEAERTLPQERQHLMLAAAGDVRPRHWQDHAEPADVFFLKGLLWRLAEHMGLDLEAGPASLPFLHPGRAAELRGARGRVGYLGELHPDLVDEWELPPRVVVAELDLTTWFQEPRRSRRFRHLPPFPAVDRDVAFVLPTDVPAAGAERVIRQHAGTLLEDIVLFDVYQGPQVPEGRRSLAYTLRYRAADRTLTDDEVDAVHNRVREALRSELGATLR